MARIFYAILVGLVGAGIVHIAILLLLPQFPSEGGWNGLYGRSEPFAVTQIEREPGSPRAAALDPLFRAALCRFDMEDGALHLASDKRMPFWSMSIRNASGQSVYSFNDRAAADRSLDVVILSPARMVEMRKAVPAEFEHSIFIETPLDAGAVIVRTFVPDGSWDEEARRFFDGLSCEPVVVDG